MDPAKIVVLFIGENHDDAQLIQRDLPGTDTTAYEVIHAGGIEKGLEQLAKGGVGAVLLDLGLPETRSLDSFEKVHAHSPAVPIIVLTSRDDDAQAGEAVQKGAQDYFVKGHVSGNLLPRFIRHVIERKQAEEELKRLNELLVRQAATDPLTGISNRPKFHEMLEAEIERSKRYTLPLALIMFEIDHVDKITEAGGHPAGDKVLREIVAMVRENIRTNDLFARWGSGEFMIMATNTTLDNARLFAEGLRLLIAHHTFQEVGSVTCSFGVVRLIDDSPDQLTRRVDQALHQAKMRGRDRVEMA